MYIDISENLSTSTTVLVLSKLKKINATAPQPQRSELLGVSPGSKLCTTFLNIAKNDELKTKSQFTATAPKPHRNHNFRQFNKDQYCTSTRYACSLETKLFAKDVFYPTLPSTSTGTDFCMFSSN